MAVGKQKKEKEILSTFLYVLYKFYLSVSRIWSSDKYNILILLMITFGSKNT